MATPTASTDPLNDVRQALGLLEGVLLAVGPGSPNEDYNAYQRVLSTMGTVSNFVAWAVSAYAPPAE